MSAPRLALYTFGMFERAADDPANDGFYLRNDPVFAAVERAPGFVARSGYASDPGPAPWGPEVYPRFFTDRNGDGWSPATLSLWEDVEAAFAFTFFGLHAEAMAHGGDWFAAGPWPPLAMWWHDGDDPPHWSEAVSRYHHLCDQGPGARAFTFKVLFDPTGARTRLDKARVAAWR